MKEMKGILLLVILGGIALLAGQVFYIVNEQEQVIITQFGETPRSCNYRTRFKSENSVFAKSELFRKALFRMGWRSESSSY